MSEVSVETLKNLLKTDVVSVTFTKVNGDKRVLKCTLQESFLPEYNSDSTRKKSDNVLSVWDVESNEWRSFRFDSVISYGIENGSQEEDRSNN